jgi:hypothetical protein
MGAFTCDACGKKENLASYFECDKCGKLLCLACVRGNTSVLFCTCRDEPNGEPTCTGTLRRK